MRHILFGVLLMLGCVPARQEVRFPLHARVANSVVFPRTVGAYAVTLSRARLGLGPIYWCATASAGAELCDQPLLEFASTATVDLLGAPQVLGEVRGYTGVVHSAQYDHAQSWTLTSSEPVALEGAPDGHALVLEGQVTGPQRSFLFRVDVDVTANRQGEMAVSYARTDAAVGAAMSAVTVAAPLDAWLDGVDWAALETLAEATGMAQVQGSHPITQGLVLALTSNARPTFEWSEP